MDVRRWLTFVADHTGDMLFAMYALVVLAAVGLVVCVVVAAAV